MMDDQKRFGCMGAAAGFGSSDELVSLGKVVMKKEMW